ncbi:MAG: DUF354 domain-containing protein, partial [Deltaproteobacteria bacterium]|nr:DUF354 domain-containing protein [Deltaproteobacteria bacterium]
MNTGKKVGIEESEMDKLNILVEMGHPAHVHFFKNPIKIWESLGHQVIIVTRDKEITHTLLDELGLKYTPLSKQKTGMLMMAGELMVRWAKMIYCIKANNIDVAISISGISTSFPAWVCGIKAITCTDTEDAVLSNKIAFKYSDVVLTPSTFVNKSEFPNIQSYESFHELAYLHPNWYQPARENLALFNIEEGERYIFIRLVQWKALHDIHEKGISEENL